MAWIKGERCGVDNCPSRFWTLTDGQYVCQNGHVRRGVEFAQDDDIIVTGRKIKRPKLERAAEVEAHRLFGTKATKIFAYALQCVLIAQTKFLVKEVGLPAGLIPTARAIWLEFIDRVSEPGQGTHAVFLALRDTISCCYLACLELRLPVFIYDFLRWMRRFEIPYVDAIKYVDPAIVQKMPRQYLSHMRSLALPEPGVLQRSVRLMARLVGRDFARPAPEPLVFKLVRDLMLPPAIYGATLRLLAAMPELAESKALAGRGPAHYEWVVMAVVVVAVKLAYGLDGIHRDVGPATKAADHPHWEVWSDFMRKSWQMDSEFLDVDERDALYMTMAQREAFIKWYHYVYANEPVKQSLNEQRLLAMFPTAEAERVTVNGPDLDTVEELASMLTETVGEDLNDATVVQESIPPSALPHLDAVPAGPGSLYQIYRDEAAPLGRAELPFLVEQLLELVSIFEGTSTEDTARMLAHIETQMRSANLPIYWYMELEGTLAAERSREAMDHLWKARAKVRPELPQGFEHWPQNAVRLQESQPEDDEPVRQHTQRRLDVRALETAESSSESETSSEEEELGEPNDVGTDADDRVDGTDDQSELLGLIDADAEADRALLNDSGNILLTVLGDATLM